MVLKVNPEDKKHPENEELRRKYSSYIQKDPYGNYSSTSMSYPAIAILSSEGDFIRTIEPSLAINRPDQFAASMHKTLKEENEVENLRAEIQKNPENLKANISLAMIYIKRGNFTEGQTLVNTISVLDPNSQSKFFTKVYTEMALASINPSNIEGGEALLDKASALDLKDESALPKLHYNFGFFYYGQSRQNNKDDPQKAEKHFKIVIDKYPQSEFYEPVQLYLAVTYDLQGKKPMAISLLEKLSSQAQDSDIQREANRISGILKNQVK